MKTQRWFLALKIFVFSAVLRWIGAFWRIGAESELKYFWIRADQRWMSLKRQPEFSNEV